MNKLFALFLINILVCFNVHAQNKVKLIHPENGATNVNETQEKNKLRTVIKWEPVSGANYYEMQIHISEDDFGNDVYANTDETSFIIGTTNDANWCCFDDGATVFWRVRAVIDGNAQAWSDIWSFTFEAFARPNDKKL